MKNLKFSELNLSNEIQRALDEMGFCEATPIQSKAIPEVMTGKDVTGLAQTGTGKTYAFGIPAIEKLDLEDKNVQILVLCPTRELAIQTSEGLEQLIKYKKDVKIVSVYGGQQIDRQIMALRRNPQIVVGTPGRVMDHLRRKTLKLNNLSMLVLDEADEMLNMGFREDIDIILKSATSEKQIVLFSATMSKGIMDITNKYQKKDAIVIKVSQSQMVTPKIEQHYLKIHENLKSDALVRIFDSMELKLGVVFCNTKRKVDDVTAHLQTNGYKVDALHGDMKQSQRDVVMKKFRSGTINVLVATDVAARGIDVDDVEIIINYNIPSDEEYYVHRIGRTGRAGKEGVAITFVNNKEMGKVRNIERYTKTTLKEYSIPTAKDLNDKKKNELLERLTKELETSKFEEEKAIITEYMEVNDKSPVDIAAALLHMKLRKNKVKEIEFAEVSRSAARTGKGDNTRLFITLGKKDNLKRADLKDYITSTVGISKNDIYDVEVLDKFSFVTLNTKVSSKVINALNNTKYNGRRVAIEISTGKKN